MKVAYRLVLLLLQLYVFTSDVKAEQLVFKTFPAIDNTIKGKVIKIQQGHDGFIWLATKSEIYRFDAINLLKLSDIIEIPVHGLNNILDISIDSKNTLWILSTNGLFHFDHASIKSPSWYKKQTEARRTYHHNGVDYLVTTTSIIEINHNTQKHYPFSVSGSPQYIKNIVKIPDTNFLYIATKEQLLSFDLNSKTFKQIDFTQNDSNPFIWDIHVDKEGDVWLSSDNGVFQSKSSDLIFWQKFVPKNLPRIIKSISSTEGNIWFASAVNGLIQFDKNTDKVIIHDENERSYSLNSNSLNKVYADSKGLLWLTTFGGKVMSTNPHLPSLEWQSNCNGAEDVYKFAAFDEGIYMASKFGLRKIASNGECSLIQTFFIEGGKASGFIPTSIISDRNNKLWIGSHIGLHLFNTATGSIKNIYTDSKIDSITLLVDFSDEYLVFGTSTGLFKYNKSKNSATKINTTETQNTFFFDVAKHNENYYFASDEGLFLLKSDGPIELKPIDQTKGFSVTSLTSINDTMFVGTKTQGIYQLNLTNNELQKTKIIKNQFLEISNLVADHQNNIWFTSDQGVTRFDRTNQRSLNINKYLGLTSTDFTINSKFKIDNQLYFGTRNGVISLDPLHSLPDKTYEIPVALTGLHKFNKLIKIDGSDNSPLKQDINYLRDLTLTYKDLSVSFSFSRLNFSDPENDTFHYILEGFDPVWTEVNFKNTTATYTNLPSGQYQFKIRTSNSGLNLNSSDVKTLNIKVLPPPWLTWWAISSYVTMSLLAIYWYVQRKIKTNQLIAERLRVEVAEKTKELNIQKQTVESLLVKKNELFSNVSHEFRTPLTLILGPIKELLVKQQQPQDINSLKMINRNANRLLSLVEQLLQIARVSNFNTIKTAPQKTQNQLQSLVESFQHMAKNKRIDLQLVNNDQSTIDVTDQFIDAVMGNLISNAIKYTPSGGSVDVSAQTSNDTLVLTVKDTGSGLSPDEQNDIFKRFKRLDSHQSIDGIGIGLSVVEEVVKVNQCEIKVNSELGVGSEFTVWVPLSDVIEVDDNQSISSLITQLQAESLEPIPEPQSSNTISEDNNLNTVLVIEDNHDMRNHIVGIVEPHYNCLAAENGVKGVACAIEQIPDLIISDVMMPEMDGFKVARIIRSDQRTSHIPFILLTALNDKVNRIKGWRENVDAYMTKPFDRDELLIQLENMLTIRDILKKKAGQEFSKGKSPTSSLPEKDQQFIDKLIETIQLKYQDPILNRAKLATEMAVSDRQLQRKVKALIDQNPMDMLREYRLNKAKELLKQGYQVSQVGDNCGFNSISYFSQCFKAQFGMSPKKYQQTE